MLCFTFMCRNYSVIPHYQSIIPKRVGFSQTRTCGTLASLAKRAVRRSSMHGSNVLSRVCQVQCPNATSSLTDNERMRKRSQELCHNECVMMYQSLAGPFRTRQSPLLSQLGLKVQPVRLIYQIQSILRSINEIKVPTGFSRNDASVHAKTGNIGQKFE